MAKWYSGKTCRLATMLTMTFGFFLVEIICGYISKSMALVADSFHMLSDVLALTIAFFCMKISKRKSKKNTFGWIRAEVLGALVNAVFLLALCFSIFIEAVKRLCEPETIEDPVKILIVGIIGLLVNVIGIMMFHGHASVHGHSHARPVPLDLDEEQEERFQLVASEAHSITVLNGKVEENGNGFVASQPLSKRDSPEDPDGKRPLTEPPGKKRKVATAQQLNMHGVFLHILGDAFGSVIVIINAVINWQVKDEMVQKYLDPSLSLVMVLIISCTTLPLLKESAEILLQTVPTHMNVRYLKEKLLAIEGVVAVHEFHVWRLAGNKVIATAHVQCRNLGDYMDLAETIKEFFHNEGIHSTTIQPEIPELDGDLAREELDRHCAIKCPPPSVARARCDSSDQCCGPVAPGKKISGENGQLNGADGTVRSRKSTRQNEDDSKTADDEDFVEEDAKGPPRPPHELV